MAGTTPVLNLFTPPGGQLFAAEAGLPQGSQAGAQPTSSTWTFTIKADDGVRDLTVGGYTAIRDGVFTAGGAVHDFARLSVTAYNAATGEVTVRYELISPHQSHPGSQTRYGDIVSYQVVLTDRDGDTATGNLLAQIRDDEGVSLVSDRIAAIAGGAAATGDLVANDRFTADGFGGVTGIATYDTTTGAVNVADRTAENGAFSLSGKYGVLTVRTTGEYSYVARDDAPGGAFEQFVYFAKDGDGDERQTTISVVVERGGSAPGDGGQVINSAGPGSTLVGGAGDDTLNGSQGSDVLTGGAGADVFAWANEPWSPATVTDFAVGTDKLNLSALFQAAGYSGSDPIADGRIVLMSQDDDTLVLFDDDGAGGDWPNYIIRLDGVSASGLTWAQLSGGGGASAPSEPPATSAGQVINSAGPGSTLTGGSGNDTLNASQGPDVLTGGGGADRFVFADENWAPATITDFAAGSDKIDLSGVFDDWGYAGTDPMADGRLILIDDGSGGTKVLLDDDGPGGDWGNYVLHVQGVAPGTLAGAGNWIF